MANLGDMQAYISARLIDPQGTAVSGDQVDDAINDAIRYWKFRRFWFNEVSFSSTLTSGSAEFPYPSDFLVPAIKDDGFAVEYGQIRYPLTKINEDVYDSLYIANGQGLPTWYARLGNTEQYRCYPIPNINYTIRCRYLKDYPALEAAGDENDFTDHADRLIELWALANLQAELRQDTTMSDYYRTAANDEWRQLKVMTDKANSAGKLTLYSNLLTGAY